MIKFIVVWFMSLFAACSALLNSIPGNDNTEQNASDSSPMVFDEAVNKAFLANVAGFWSNNFTVVYKISDDGYFFFTNSSGSDGSFTLETNYSFYGALENKKGIFITNGPNNSLMYMGFKVDSKGRLGIEKHGHTNPKNANSGRYHYYGRK